MKHFLLFAVIFLSGFGAASARADGENTTLGSCNHIFYNGAGLDNQQTSMGACFADLVAVRAAATGTPLGLYDGGPSLRSHATNTVYAWRYSVGGHYTEWTTPGKTFTPCQAGYLFDALTTTCYPDPTIDPCPPGQISGPGGICTTDPDPQETPCKNVLGYVNGVEVCKDKQDECEAQGGAYGIIMDEEGCLIGEEDPEKECASETYIFGNEYGGYVCVHPDPQPPKPPGEPPEVPSCPEGYYAAGNSCILDEPDREGDDDDDGVPNGNEPGRGAGQCDPTSVAYAECIGQMTQVSDVTGEGIRNAANRTGAAAADGIVGAAKAALGNGDSGFVEPTGIVESVTGLGVFSPGSCTDLTAALPMDQTMTIPCSETQRLRDLLFVLFPILTLFYIVQVALMKTPDRV